MSKQYSDLPEGFRVYSDVPEGFSVVEPSAAQPRDPGIDMPATGLDRSSGRKILESLIPGLRLARIATSPNPVREAGLTAEPSIMSEMSAEALRGVPEAVTNIPKLPAALWNILKQSPYLGGRPDPAMFPQMASPVTTPAKQAIELAAPGTVNAPTPESPEARQAARSAGTMLAGAELPNVASGLGQGVSALNQAAGDPWQRLMGRLKITPIQQLENKLGPSGDERLRLAKDVAPKLAADDTLMNARPGQAFDRALYQRFRQAGDKVRQVEAAIPDETIVQLGPINEKFTDLINAYKEFGAEDAVKALTNQKNRIANAAPPRITAQGLEPATRMSWGQFIEFKRRFGTDLKRLGVWKRINAGTATERDVALSQAYGQMIEASSGISEELTAANHQFSLMNDAIRAAGIAADDGRRVATVGKATSPVSRAAKVAGPYVGGAIGAGLLWRIYAAVSGE